MVQVWTVVGVLRVWRPGGGRLPPFTRTLCRFRFLTARQDAYRDRGQLGTVAPELRKRRDDRGALGCTVRQTGWPTNRIIQPLFDACSMGRRGLHRTDLTDQRAANKRSTSQNGTLKEYIRGAAANARTSMASCVASTNTESDDIRRMPVREEARNDAAPAVANEHVRRREVERAEKSVKVVENPDTERGADGPRGSAYRWS